jgi:hypothetical protein
VVFAAVDGACSVVLAGAEAFAWVGSVVVLAGAEAFAWVGSVVVLAGVEGLGSDETFAEADELT